MGMNAIVKHNIIHSLIILNFCFHKVDILENAAEKLPILNPTVVILCVVCILINVS